jgi:hypothetical protein
MDRPQLAPILVFGFNRPTHLRNCLKSLMENPESYDSDVYIFLDGPQRPDQVDIIEKTFQVTEDFNNFKNKTVVRRNHNLGLKKSIEMGIGQVFNSSSRVIVLEDDLTVSCRFLEYMNSALNYYENVKQVSSIQGFSYLNFSLNSNYFLRGGDCWGWGTWKDRWMLYNPNGHVLLNDLIHKKLTYKFDFNNGYPYTKLLYDAVIGKISSWAILWHATMFLQNKYSLYPSISLVTNNGGDGSGTNFEKTDKFSRNLGRELNLNFDTKIETDKQIYKKIRKVLGRKPFFLMRIKVGISRNLVIYLNKKTHTYGKTFH